MSKPTVTISFELPLEIKQRLEDLARITQKSESSLAAEAISSYVALQQWQLRQIEKGLQEAEAGDFASDEEVAAIFSQWTSERPDCS